jgi:hypothetical protein
MAIAEKSFEPPLFHGPAAAKTRALSVEPRFGPEPDCL